jgi:LacI family transcriptional regulator
VNDEIAAVQTLINARVDAILLSISMETTRFDHIKEALERGIRVMFFDRIITDIQTGSVTIHDELGAYQNVHHLLEQGYRRIVHVAGADHINIYNARKRGYLKAMTEAGIEVPEKWIMEMPLIQEGGSKAFEEAMKLSPQPDAFFCAGDFAALGVLQAALHHGIKIPEELGITGFANEPFTAFLNPSLTTVDQRGGEMGRRVAEMFLACNEMEELSSCERVVLQPELIIRHSSLKQN